MKQIKNTINSIINTQKDDNFDNIWLSRFEELGKSNVPAYLRSSFPSETYFEQREIFLRHLVLKLMESLSPSDKKKATCLDLGCNNGLYSKMLHDCNLDVCGIDYSDNLIHEAKTAYPDINFIKANGYGLPFKDNSFNFIVSFGVIQCVANYQEVIQEIFRVLRPQGIAIIETNRVFPLIERVIRNASWTISGKMSIREAIHKTRRFSQSSSIGYEPKKYLINDILKCLLDLNIEKIIIHDPARLWLFHNWFWGISFIKGDSYNASVSSKKIKYCPLCRRSSKWKSEFIPK